MAYIRSRFIQEVAANVPNLKDLNYLDQFKKNFKGLYPKKLALDNKLIGDREILFLANEIGIKITCAMEDITRHPQLTELVLSHNEIGQAGLEALTTHILIPSFLRNIDLSFNRIKFAEAFAFVSSAKALNQHFIINLSDNWMSAEEYGKLDNLVSGSNVTLAASMDKKPIAQNIVMPGVPLPAAGFKPLTPAKLRPLNTPDPSTMATTGTLKSLPTDIKSGQGHSQKVEPSAETSVAAPKEKKCISSVKLAEIQTMFSEKEIAKRTRLHRSESFSLQHSEKFVAKTNLGERRLSLQLFKLLPLQNQIIENYGKVEKVNNIEKLDAEYEWITHSPVSLSKT